MQRLKEHLKKKKKEKETMEIVTVRKFPREYLTPITEQMEEALNRKELLKSPSSERIVLSEDRLTIILKNGWEAGYAFADRNGNPYVDSSGNPRLMWTMVGPVQIKTEKKATVVKDLHAQQEEILRSQQLIEQQLIEQQRLQQIELERIQKQQLHEELQLDSAFPHEVNTAIQQPGCDIDFSLITRVQRPNLNLSGLDEPLTLEPYVPGKDYYLVKVYIRQASGEILPVVNYFDIDYFQRWIRTGGDIKCRHPEWEISLRLDNIKIFTYAPQSGAGKNMLKLIHNTKINRLSKRSGKKVNLKKRSVKQRLYNNFQKGGDVVYFQVYFFTDTPLSSNLKRDILQLFISLYGPEISEINESNENDKLCKMLITDHVYSKGGKYMYKNYIYGLNIKIPVELLGEMNDDKLTFEEDKISKTIRKSGLPFRLVKTPPGIWSQELAIIAFENK